MAQVLTASGGTSCPCVTGKCPCKCSQPGGDGAKVPDPWSGFHTGKVGATKFANLTPNADGAASNPFGIGAGIGAPGDDRKSRWGGGGLNATQAQHTAGMPPGLKSEEITKITVNSKLFDEKTAREKGFQYDGLPSNGGHEWRSDVADYFVSKCPGAGPWLSWVEDHGSEDITADMVQTTLQEHAVMTDDLNPVVLSHHIWGFLQHCLSGSGKQIFKSTERQDGFNVWRKLTLEINSRTVVVRHSLRNQCQQVGQAQHASKVWQSISDWESLYVRYRKSRYRT